MSNPNTDNSPARLPRLIYSHIVDKHVAEKKYPQIHTRFPPERMVTCTSPPKSICLNFGIAANSAASATAHG